MRQLPVVVLSGLRQSGKSTFLKNEKDLLGSHKYRPLDDFAMLAAARANPESLLEGPTIIDKAQRAPELLAVIKKLVDEDRRPGQYILSGSANLLLLNHVSDTHAGRAVYLPFEPMTLREILGNTSEVPFLVEFMKRPHVRSESRPPIEKSSILAGGMPPV